jgi:hypothetical protein
MRFTLLLVLSLFALESTAAMGEDSGALSSTPSSTPSSAPLPRKITLTLSPLWAVAALPDIWVEYRPAIRWGFVANTMSGEFNVDRFKGGSSDDGRFFVGGAQVRRYWGPGGSHLAGEVSYWRIDADAASSGGLTGRFQQWRTGALIGYKMVSRFGMTLDLQGGAYVAVLQSDKGVESGFGDPPRAGPILRANIGWSVWR